MNTSLLLPLVFLLSCEPSTFREGKIFAGGQYVSPATLNLGERIYKEHCLACHGEKGDGQGVAAKGLLTPPRDFTKGSIKFGDVLSGELPHDASIYQTLTYGLGGTAMLPWDLSQPQMVAVWQYIKTFAPSVWEGKEKKLGEKILPTQDPFGLARKTLAIDLGRKIYHTTANCQSCHRAYISAEEFRQMSKEETLPPDFYKLKPQESDHSDFTSAPPDFTFHPLRSIRGVRLDDLYVRLAAGVGGTTMPPWKGTLDDDEIWALAYYIQHLMEMRDQPARRKLIERLGE